MKVLVIAPHADDEVLGVGGTMARLADQGSDVVVAVMTGHGDDAAHPIWPSEEWEKVRAEALAAHELLGVRETVFRNIPAALVADQPSWKVNQATKEVIEEIRPDSLFLPFPYDLHRDHREIFHSFSVAFRPSSEAGRRIKSIFVYEVMSETHWNVPYLEPGFTPNAWSDISGHLKVKLEALKCFASQMQSFPNARSLEAVEALAKWRGSLIGFQAAEAFVQIRSLL